MPALGFNMSLEWAGGLVGWWADGRSATPSLGFTLLNEIIIQSDILNYTNHDP